MANKKKAKEVVNNVAWQSPEPTSFLECHGKTVPALRQKDLKKLPNFLETTVAKMEVGKEYYLVYKIGSKSWGHLGRVVEIADAMVRVHFADCNVLTEPDEAEPDYFLDMNLKCTDTVFSTHTEHITPIIPTVVVDEKKIRLLIEADKTIKRMEKNPDKKAHRAARIDMLFRAVRKVLLVKPKELAEAAKSEDALSTFMATYVEEAIGEVSQECQSAHASKGLNDLMEPKLGKLATNCNIAAEATSKMLNPERQQSHDTAALAEDLKMIKKQLEMICLGSSKQARQAEEEQTPEKVAGTLSMDGTDGACCYHLGGIAIELSKDAFAVLSKLAKEAPKLVSSAKQTLIKNLTKMHEKMERIADFIDGEHFASSQWKNILGETVDAIMTNVLDGKRYGGIVELALMMWHTNIEVVVLQAKGIHAMSTDLELKGAIHPAMLGSLPTGPVEKTKRLFVVLEPTPHFFLGFTKQGNIQTPIFNIGKEADEAQNLIVALLKSQNRGPLKDLSEAERDAEIARVFDQPRKGVSWARVTAPQETGPAAGQKKATPAAAPAPAAGQNNAAPALDAANSPTTELCRNYEKDQRCRFGERCRFEHDDSRKGRNRRNRKQKRAEVAAIVKASRGRSRSPRTSDKHKGRSRSRSRSDSRGHSRGRSSSGSRSPPRKPQWTKVASQKTQLRVRCRKSVHPVAWRGSLSSINKAAHSLITWVERDKSDEDWLLVQCKGDDAGKLAKLLEQNFTVERQRRRPKNNGNQRAHHCAEFLNGARCKHHAPYCK